MRAVTIDSDLATLFTFTPRKPPITPIHGVSKVEKRPGVFFFCWLVRHAEILQKPGRPLPCPYLPTYLPTLLMGN